MSYKQLLNPKDNKIEIPNTVFAFICLYTESIKVSSIWSQGLIYCGFSHILWSWKSKMWSWKLKSVDGAFGFNDLFVMNTIFC